MTTHQAVPTETERVLRRALDCAFEVHRRLGPGFRERIYETARCLELDRCGVKFEREKAVGVKYREWTISGQKVDLIVESAVILELKVVKLRQLHQRQLVSYLRTTGLRVGMLINFNTVLWKHGLQRVVV